MLELLALCEDEIDFWPAARRYTQVGEYEIAFEGIYLFLLKRDDLWAKHHSLIAAIKRQYRNAIDFDELELLMLDDGRDSERKALTEWRNSFK